MEKVSHDFPELLALGVFLLKELQIVEGRVLSLVGLQRKFVFDRLNQLIVLEELDRLLVLEQLLAPLFILLRKKKGLFLGLPLLILRRRRSLLLQFLRSIFPALLALARAKRVLLLLSIFRLGFQPLFLARSFFPLVLGQGNLAYALASEALSLLEQLDDTAVLSKPVLVVRKQNVLLILGFLRLIHGLEEGSLVQLGLS